MSRKLLMYKRNKVVYITNKVNTKYIKVGIGDDINISDKVKDGESTLSLKGNSLVNLNKYMPKDLSQTISGWYIEKNLTDRSLLIPNKEYTICFNFKKNSDTSNGAYNTFEIGLGSDHTILLGVLSAAIKEGFNKVKFTFKTEPDRYPQYKYVNLRVIRRNTAPVSGQTCSYTLSNYILLEGDWTNKEVPEYFEKMKSVGELTEDGKQKN